MEIIVIVWLGQQDVGDIVWINNCPNYTLYSFWQYMKPGLEFASRMYGMFTGFNKFNLDTFVLFQKIDY